MKKYIVGLLTMVLAVGFAAFTKPKVAEKKFAAIYMQYNGIEGIAETVVSNYTQVSGTLPTCISDEKRLCWIVVDDLNLDGGIQQVEPDAFVTSFDGNGDNILSDQFQVAGRLERRKR